MLDETDEEAFKIFIQALLHILRPTEGVVFDVDGNKENRVIVWHNPEKQTIFITAADEKVKKIDLSKGNLVWMHKTKKDVVDAQIDDYIVKKEIDEICGEIENGNIRPSK